MLIPLSFCANVWHYSQDRYHLAEIMDFVITLGGDGTLLYASSLFPKSMPPVICYHMGTLGFLTPFSAMAFESPLSRVRVNQGWKPMDWTDWLLFTLLRFSALIESLPYQFFSLFLPIGNCRGCSANRSLSSRIPHYSKRHAGKSASARALH